MLLFDMVIALVSPPCSALLFCETMRTYEPGCPEPKYSVVLLKVILPDEVGLDGLSAMSATLLLPIEALTLMSAELLTVMFPTTHTWPASVTTAEPEMLRSQLIFLGPSVTAPVIEYDHGLLCVPPAVASAFHSSIFESEIGSEVVARSVL